MDAITLSQVLETLKRMGAPNPTNASQEDLFSFLKELEGYVNQVEAKLGINTDAAGTGTVFARLAQLAAYVDAVEGLIGTVNPTTAGTDTLFNYLKKLDNLVGANNASAGTGSMFARLAQIAGYVDAVEGYVDTLESSLGQTGDAANAAGSAHAKLKDIKNQFPSIGWPKYWNVKAVQRGTGGGAYNSGQTFNIPISSVNTSNSFVIASVTGAQYDTGGAYAAASNIRSRLTSSTNLEIYFYEMNSNDDAYVYFAWEVIEMGGNF